MSVRTYLIKRLLLLVPVLIGVATFVFAILHLTPGDPAQLIAGIGASTERVEAIRRDLGLDRPIWEQYVSFMVGLLYLDLGQSYRVFEGVPVTSVIRSRLPMTIELAIYAQTFGILIGVPTGIISAIKQDDIEDHLARLGALSGISIPVFWSGPILILIFAQYLGLFPTSGRIGAAYDISRVTGFLVLDTLILGDFGAFISAVKHLFLPSLVIGIFAAGWISRFMRSSLLEVIRQNYIRTARAKGQGRRITLMKHGFKNALIPVVTIIGIQFGTMLGGAILTEVVFGLPGMGLMLIQAIQANDYPIVQGAILVFALLFALVNIAVDILYSYLDPRIQQ